MGIDLQRLINTRIATRLGLGLIGRLPTQAGYRLADFAADRLTGQQDQPMIAGMRGNLKVVCGENLTTTELDEVARRTMRNRAKALFDFYHALGNESEMTGLLDYGPRFQDVLNKNVSREHGAVAVMVHMGNPEVLGIASRLMGMSGIALTFPGENGGYEVLNELREQVGYQAMPTTMTSLKKAIQHLKDKGTIFTGLERPLPESGYRPKFFGIPTPLPVHHVMMAIKADVPVIVFASKRRADGRYDLLISEFIYMERHADRKTELIANTERLLKVAEGYIRQAPEEWAMFYPLWPENKAELQ